MARPIKVGIDYFGVDVTPDEKVEYIESTYEAEGYYLWIKFLQRVYSTGYYMEWNKYQAAAMKKATGISLERIDEILDVFLEVGIFNRELFDEYSILTSRGVQKRFYAAASKRTHVEIVPEYVLHDELWKWFDGKNSEETQVNSSENDVDDEVNSEETQKEIPNEEGFFGKNSEETTLEEELSSDNGSQSAEYRRNNPEESTQSKVKQSKVKQSKAKEQETRAPKPPKISYAENVQLTEAECQKLVDKYGQSATDWMIEKLDNYKGANGKKYKNDYRAILNWVVEKYQEQLAKGQIRGQMPAERSEVNDSIEPDLRQQDWNNW